MAASAASKRLWRTRAGRSSLSGMARITIEIPDELAERLQSQARAEGQTFDQWASDAIARRVEAMEAFEAFVAEGVADADAGRVIPVEDGFAEARAIIENARRRAG